MKDARCTPPTASGDAAPPRRCRRTGIPSGSCKPSSPRSTTSAPPSPESRSSSWTSRRPGAPRHSAASPRSAPSRCAAASCSGSSRPSSTPPSPSRRSSPSSPASPTRWSATHRASTARCPPSSSSRPAASSWRTTPASTSGSSRRPPPASALRWPGFPVLDTLQLARQLVVRDESPNHRLSSLAQVFGSPTTPDHRALHDARATVDVLHGLIERVGNLGVHTLEELSSYSSRVTPSQRRKRFLADPLPSAPGVYLFKDGSDRVLYVGTSRDIRTRVRSYFTASEQRSRMAEMVRLAHVVHPDRVPDLARGAGPRAAAHRRAQAPLQPAVEERPQGHVGQAHAGALPPPVDRQAGAGRRRPLHRAVPVPGDRPVGHRRGPRGRAPAPVHRSPHRTRHRLRPRRHGPLRRPVHRRTVRG